MNNLIRRQCFIIKTRRLITKETLLCFSSKNLMLYSETMSPLGI